MSILESKFNYNHLSVKDLTEARDIFHVHLINKRNVIATAIGRYRIRKEDPWPNEQGYQETLKPVQKPARTLENSEVRDYSWPCILVFVEKWETASRLIQHQDDSLVPRSIYLPDGRIVPICVIEAPKSVVSDDTVDTSTLVFPANYIGGGFPLIVESQGQERVASVGCLVTDGNKYYALTNKHVVGEKGTPVYTKLKGMPKQIGQSSGKQIGKLLFEDTYEGWKGKNIVVNCDFGLIEVENVNQWKTDVVGIGQMDELASLNTSNITLALVSAVKFDGGDAIGVKKVTPKVRAYGAVSGPLEAEIVGLFYRYKSVGSVEYVADFLFGGVDGKPLNIHHGDSGTLWMLAAEDESDPAARPINMPIALHWGQHNLLAGGGLTAIPYALAANLTTACVELDVDVVRGWNIDNDYTWGKTGHFKIAAKSCELVTGTKLSKLLIANQKNIGYVDNDLLTKNVVNGAYNKAKNEFVPLSDVADIIWRTTRKTDASNHFADIDESHPQVHGGLTLLELCMADPTKIDIDFWLDYFKQLDTVDPHIKNGRIQRRTGALPFRVWQMYNQMVAAVNAGSLAEFICAGGTLAHYVGDACQPLHVSHLHHGRTPDEKDVHSVYETNMLDRQAVMPQVFNGINAAASKVKTADLIGASGYEAAKRVVELMNFTFQNLAPVEVCDSYTDNGGNTAKMWAELGARTIINMAEGCRVMAILWQSAWRAGGGNSNFTSAQMTEIPRDDLKALYNDKLFVPAFSMRDPKFKALLV